MSDGDRYVYTKDKGTLNVASGIAVLDLNGHYLSRNLEKTATAYGSTITMKSSTTLRLDDTSTVQRHVTSLGRVTGGNNSRAYGGGVGMDGVSECRFILANGAIYGNTSYEGGGITIYDNCKAFMFGGLISGNTANHSTTDKTYSSEILSGGGAVVRCGAKFYVYGGAITGNYAYQNAGGVALWSGQNEPKTPTELLIYGGIVNKNTSKYILEEKKRNTNSGY